MENKSKTKSPTLLFLYKVSWNLWPDSWSLSTWILVVLPHPELVSESKDKETNPHKLFIYFALYV